MRPRKLRVYDISTEWSRIRVRMATKPDSIRIEDSRSRNQARTFFEPVIDIKNVSISGSELVFERDYRNFFCG